MNNVGKTVLYLDDQRRNALIEEHQFFVAQAKQRLLDQFTDLSMETEAQKVSEEAWNSLGKQFDPDRHDPAEFAELADHMGYERYRMLSEMREHVRFSMVAAFYHAFEKSLKEWIAAEFRHITSSKSVKDRIWSATMDELFTLLKEGGTNFFVTKSYRDLRQCRLVVNAYKHGEGVSLDVIRRIAPDLIVPDDPDGFYKNFPVEFFDHTHLKIGDDDFDRFSEGIVEFWRGLPTYFRTTDFKKFPKWLEDAANGPEGR